MGFWEDLGNGAASVASTLGDVAEGVVEVFTETAENVVDGVADAVQDGTNEVTDWLASNGGPVVGAVAHVVGGVVVGVVEGVQDVLGDVLHIVDDVGGIVGSLLRGDLPRLVEELLNLVIDVADLGLDLLRIGTGGYVVAAIVDNFQRADLREFVRNLITERFAGHPDLATILARLNLDTAHWGLAAGARSHVMMLDTGTDGVAQTVRAMHTDGELDLYALAGLLSFDSFSFGRARTLVRVIDFTGQPALLPVNRAVVARFLDGEDLRLQIFALTPAALHDDLRVARTACARMGFRLDWNDEFDIPTLGRMTTHEITTPAEYRLNLARQGRYFQDSGLKEASTRECPVVTLAAFRYALNARGNEQYGQASGRELREGRRADGCTTPRGRTDRCCALVDRTGGTGSGVIYRDFFPHYAARFVLAHEIGHYFGLCHLGHDGVQNLMFSIAGGSNPLDWGLWQYYLHSEPRFTHDDAKNAWRFVVDQMPECLGRTPTTPDGASQRPGVRV